MATPYKFFVIETEQRIRRAQEFRMEYNLRISKTRKYFPNKPIGILNHILTNRKPSRELVKKCTKVLLKKNNNNNENEEKLREKNHKTYFHSIMDGIEQLASTNRIQYRVAPIIDNVMSGYRR